MIESIYSCICTPSYQPSVDAETKLAISFQTSLRRAIDNSSIEALTTINGYLKCVMALSKKDEKFISCYFEKMDIQLSATLVNILRKSEQPHQL